MEHFCGDGYSGTGVVRHLLSMSGCLPSMKGAIQFSVALSKIIYHRKDGMGRNVSTVDSHCIPPILFHIAKRMFDTTNTNIIMITSTADCYSEHVVTIISVLSFDKSVLLHAMMRNTATSSAICH